MKVEAVVKELLKNTREELREVLDFDINNPSQPDADPNAHWIHQDVAIVCQMIANDGFDITGFGLDQTPAPKVYCFYNPTTKQVFDVSCILPCESPRWSFSYVNNYFDKERNYFLADTIQEAIEKFAY